MENKRREAFVLVRSRDTASSETQEKWKKRRTERNLVSSELGENKIEAVHTKRLLCGVKSSDRVGARRPQGRLQLSPRTLRSGKNRLAEQKSQRKFCSLLLSKQRTNSSLWLLQISGVRATKNKNKIFVNICKLHYL